MWDHMVSVFKFILHLSASLSITVCKAAHCINISKVINYHLLLLVGVNVSCEHMIWFVGSNLKVRVGISM